MSTYCFFRVTFWSVFLGTNAFSGSRKWRHEANHTVTSASNVDKKAIGRLNVKVKIQNCVHGTLYINVRCTQWFINWGKGALGLTTVKFVTQLVYQYLSGTYQYVTVSARSMLQCVYSRSSDLTKVNKIFNFGTAVSLLCWESSWYSE